MRVPNYFEVLENIYNKLIFDNRLLSPSGLDLMRKSVLSTLSGFYFRSSVYNPAMLYWIFNNLIEPKKILTPTLGWNSYLYGAIQLEELEEYVGIDVLSSVCKKAKIIGKEKKTTIYCKPSESLIELFKKKYSNYFDSVFFSPPFYDLEIYDGKEQSINKYKTLDEWLDKYWDKTCELCSNSLQKKGKFTYIIANYGKYTNLKKQMLNIAKKYFKYKKSYKIYVKKPNIINHNENFETLYILEK